MIGKTYTLKEISKIIDPEVVGDLSNLDVIINRIATDSRFKSIDSNTLFFAIKTEKNDGHLFIEPAFKRGVRYFVIDQKIDTGKFPEACFLKVSRSVDALQRFAGHHRSLITYPILTITGSNGKTVVKEWLYQLLSGEKSIFRSPKSYNSQIGVPISLLNLPIQGELGIIEAGISKVGEMEKLERMIKPDIGILTNIHQAHRENFKSKVEQIQEKLKLFKGVKTFFYRKDDETVNQEIVKEQQDSGFELISWSNKTDLGDYKATWEKSGGTTAVLLKGKDIKFEFNIPFTDEASVENAIHCALIAKHFKLDDDVLKQNLSGLFPVAMRLEQIKGINNCTIVNDSYNSDLTSLEVALDFLNMQKQHQSKTLIISDIVQSGKMPQELYSEVNELCRKSGVNLVIGVGDEILKNQSKFDTPFRGYHSTTEFLSDTKNHSFYNQSILIKGSRSFEFERISSFLEYLKHDTHIDVNLSAIIENLNYFKFQLKPEVKVMVMVKAFSYGTGSYEIANVLQHHHVDYLAVAYIDEGVELRKKGIKTPIMVMNPAIGGLETMSNYDLEPEVYSLRSLGIVNSYCRHTGKSIKIHIKVETGMHRLGFEFEELDSLVELLKGNENITVGSVFSHLVASDNPEFDAISQSQKNRLILFCKGLNDNGIAGFIRHVLNSDGILRFPDFQLEMVRLGIGLYGITSIERKKSELKSVVSLKSRISQIKTLKMGQGLGYNLNFKAEKEMRTATVAIGYADGLSRSLGNRNWSCKVKGHEVPIIGNICMDMCMLDVTDVNDLYENAEVEIISGNADLYKMALLRNTIPYEVLTSFSERIKRQFYYGD